MKGFFGDLFDLDHDGDLDPLERAMDFATFMSMTDDEEDDGSEEDEDDDREDEMEFSELEDDEDEDDNDSEDDDICISLGIDKWQKEELEAAGIDVRNLEFMDDDERREELEDAGLDPDDYDFL